MRLTRGDVVPHQDSNRHPLDEDKDKYGVFRAR
jgi:hypothetical protein